MRADTGYKKGEYFIKTCKQVDLFYKKHGRWPRQICEDKEEERLGVWCKKMRQKYSRGELSVEYLQVLEKIKFSFEPMTEQWLKKVERLKKYFDKDSLPHFTDPLRAFVRDHIGNYNALPKWKREKLSSISFLENCRKLFQDEEDFWQRNFLATVNFFLTYQKLPTRQTNPQLEGWVSKQRQLLKRGQLCDERVQLFQDTGIDLLHRTFAKVVLSWEQGYKEVKEFTLKNGKLPRPNSDRKLYWWLYHQRKRSHEGKLNKQQIKMLEQLDAIYFRKDRYGE
jgi:hypothetical protein